MTLLAFVLAAVTATVDPPAPHVGDLVTIRFAAPVKLEPSPSYEVVQRSGNRVVVRTFEPKPFTVSGLAGTQRVKVVVPVKSVLAPNDPMTPAPLAPPVPVPYPLAPFIAIAVAAFAALAAWLVLWWREKAVVAKPVRQQLFTPQERYRDAVLALLRDAAHPRRFAALADETRAYLAETRSLGTELTTFELVPRLDESDRVVEDILHNGDVEKFAPDGRPAADFDDVAERALAFAEALP